MGLKLYYGGYGEYKVFAVAESEQNAVEAIGRKINAPFLPVTAECISEVDGYEIFAGSPRESEEAGEEKPEAEEVKEESEPAPQKKFKCKECGLEFDSLAELGRHAKKEHPKKGG